MSIPLPIIEGRTDEKNETEERVERQTLLQQAAEMDAPRQIPTDEMREYSDIEKPESQEKLLETATEINKRVITDKQRATLERARKAKAEKKRRMESGNVGDNHNAAQGTPVPDYLVDAIKSIQENQEKYFNRLEDLLKIQPYEGPLQAQEQIVSNTSRPRLVTPPSTANDPQSRFLLPSSENPSPPENSTLLQVSDSRRTVPKQESRMLQESDSFKRKFQKAFENNEYYTEEVNQRARQNPREMGQHSHASNASYSDIFW